MQEDEFREAFAAEQQNLHPKAADYILNYWMECGVMWANFGRRFFPEDSETNNLAERYNGV